MIRKTGFALRLSGHSCRVQSAFGAPIQTSCLGDPIYRKWRSLLVEATIYRGYCTYVFGAASKSRRWARFVEPAKSRAAGNSHTKQKTKDHLAMVCSAEGEI